MEGHRGDAQGRCGAGADDDVFADVERNGEGAGIRKIFAEGGESLTGKGLCIALRGQPV